MTKTIAWSFFMWVHDTLSATFILCYNQKQQNKESFTFEFYEKSPLKLNKGTFICNPLNGKHLRFII